ncbi:hypothetical protein [Polynucleobacter brandtiae]|uniref:Uncharacterized protein n=1 Tax=Polynucleobacter brandtiae TaxID=1938816 RepID=A0A2M8VPP6_9BURK|nr:hypothetical protein [Polynucleobacter brandtiae]PJI79147.1 hypothetical protein B0G85_1249 [Polynucleobacter brandtiae]
MSNLLNSWALSALANSSSISLDCQVCVTLQSPGWESIPGGFDLHLLELVGTLRPEDAPEMWDEYHPEGTNLWSDDAPIAPTYHPYNRCDIYQCSACNNKYLRYGEYGGYYVEERIRPLIPELIVHL